MQPNHKARRHAFSGINASKKKLAKVTAFDVSELTEVVSQMVQLAEAGVGVPKNIMADKADTMATLEAAVETLWRSEVSLSFPYFRFK